MHIKMVAYIIDALLSHDNEVSDDPSAPVNSLELQAVLITPIKLTSTQGRICALYTHGKLRSEQDLRFPMMIIYKSAKKVKKGRKREDAFFTRTGA